MKPIQRSIAMLGVMLAFSVCTPMVQATSHMEDALQWVDREVDDFVFELEDSSIRVTLARTYAPFGLAILIFNGVPDPKEVPTRPAITMIRLHDDAKHLVDMEIHRDAERYSIDLPDTPRSLRIEIKLSSGTVLRKTVHISPKLKLKIQDDKKIFPAKGDPRTFRGKVSGDDKQLYVATLCLPRPGEGGIEQMEIVRLDPVSTSETEHEPLVMRFIAKQPLTGLKATVHRIRNETASAAAAAGVKFKFTCRTQHRHYELIQAVEF